MYEGKNPRRFFIDVPTADEVLSVVKAFEDERMQALEGAPEIEFEDWLEDMLQQQVTDEYLRSHQRFDAREDVA